MRNRLRDLSELGRVFRKIDPLFVHLLARRGDAVVQVDRAKRAKDEPDPIRRPEVEERRIQEIRKEADRLGVDSDFAAGLMRMIIEKSCADQERMRESGPPEPEVVDDLLWRGGLRQNLLRLTEAAAPSYEEGYGGVATQTHRNFEERMIRSVLLHDLSSRFSLRESVALDLGCATGRQARALAPYFKKVVGLDVSPAMIEEARKRNGSPKVSFRECDLELGLPFEDESVAFTLMNMGTGSDVANLSNLLEEIQRVLKPKGAILISFYNKDALFYQLGIPYYPGLSAQFNEMRNTLDVRMGEEVYRVFARPYSISEIRAILKKTGLEVRKDSVWSHPTLASLIPDTAEYGEKALKRMGEADEALAPRCMTGAYLVVVAEKP